MIGQVLGGAGKQQVRVSFDIGCRQDLLVQVVRIANQKVPAPGIEAMAKLGAAGKEFQPVLIRTGVPMPPILSAMKPDARRLTMPKASISESISAPRATP